MFKTQHLGSYTDSSNNEVYSIQTTIMGNNDSRYIGLVEKRGVGEAYPWRPGNPGAKNVTSTATLAYPFAVIIPLCLKLSADAITKDNPVPISVPVPHTHASIVATSADPNTS